MPSHTLSSPSPSAFIFFQHQGAFQWVNCLLQLAKILEFQLQHQSFQWIFRTDFLLDWPVWSPSCPRHSQASLPTQQFKSINSLVLFLLYGPTLISVHDMTTGKAIHSTDTSVQFNCSVVSNSSRPHGLQYTRLPCPSSTPGACSNSYPLNLWCCPTISSSVISFSSCLQSFPGSGSFPMRQFFESSGQNIGVSASSSVLPMNIQDWSPLGLTSLIP